MEKSKKTPLQITVVVMALLMFLFVQVMLIGYKAVSTRTFTKTTEEKYAMTQLIPGSCPAVSSARR